MPSTAPGSSPWWISSCCTDTTSGPCSSGVVNSSKRVTAGTVAVRPGRRQTPTALVAPAAARRRALTRRRALLRGAALEETTLRVAAEADTCHSCHLPPLDRRRGIGGRDQRGDVLLRGREVGCGGDRVQRVDDGRRRRRDRQRGGGRGGRDRRLLRREFVGGERAVQLGAGACVRDDEAAGDRRIAELNAGRESEGAVHAAALRQIVRREPVLTLPFSIEIVMRLIAATLNQFAPYRVASMSLTPFQRFACTRPSTFL